MLIHPKSVASDSATLGEGSVVMAGAIIQSRVEVGSGCIFLLVRLLTMMQELKSIVILMPEQYITK